MSAEFSPGVPDAASGRDDSPGARWIRALAAALLLAACGGDATGLGTFAGQFDAFWTAFDRTYPYFVYKGYDWDSVRTATRPRVDTVATQDQLIALLHEAVVPLRDLHIFFRRPGGSTLATYTPAATVNFDQPAWLQIVAGASWTQRSNWGYGRLGGIPYVAIGGWDPGFVTAEFDAALETFRNDTALILDVRPNGGGSDRPAFDVAGRFTGTPIVSEYVRFRSGPGHADLTPYQSRSGTPRGSWTFGGRVAVLSGRGVFSSNEHFIAVMRLMPTVTVIGDTTGGASGNPAPVTLGGGWSVLVPRWIAYTAPDTAVIEWRGIPPNIAVPWRADLAAAGRDTVLEFARAWIACGGCPSPSPR